MPELPSPIAHQGALVVELPSPAAPADDEEDPRPYRRIAADLRGAIRIGLLRTGDEVPTAKELAERYAVSVGTAHRATALLADDGAITVSRGHRGVVS